MIFIIIAVRTRNITKQLHQLSSQCLLDEFKIEVLDFNNILILLIFGPKRGEVTGVWRKLHNEELHNLYSSPSIIIMIKSRRMKWAGHVSLM
jgi:hypothetical protein